MSEQEERIVREFAAEITESGDGRTLDVRIVPYNTPTEVADSPEYGGTGIPYVEEWLPGVFTHQTRAAHRVDVVLDENAKGVLVNFEHQPGIGGVVGRGRSIWDEQDGAYGSFRMLSTQDADKALELVRDGVLTGVSLEAIARKSVRRNGVVQREKADLKAIALCRTPAYREAEILAVRQQEVVAEPEPEPSPEPEPEPEPVPEPEPEQVSRVASALEKVGYQPLVKRAVVNRPWDGSAARFEDDEYERSCLLCRGGDEPPKTRCSLPVLEPNGDLNVNALGAAAARLNQIGDASLAQKASAARKLLRYYRQADREPPQNVVALAGR